ncbi:hypothetical protein ALQ03_103296 [Pseudomonas savastanoi pv. glycinea]|uniref:Uncharacterized protein n=1 Tax=Pseudomonas savastanoi pv. glycinea TaxID=318 RepID=A0A0P9QX50_PSESG|nr:hypothetical protein PsgB076_04666 [Pseudomonas savastanoi pv. glycinea str. B076]EFW86318.1 hypothetical protein PsgRace4_09235 [Pseudomonas savastanoi pv. glycinea str. race 4]KPX36637.1 hypothetical protein ALO37_103046 [Pseudomonas savastanoi pv. glycinea]RMM85432.1 hypothetical protein ALQ70_103201 [Pseudomonas savastanoi pv. glycinea]RMM99534.1 hypothetical protein ALQ68_103840 [Pseudomonas savastanoi pv. glycinea]
MAQLYTKAVEWIARASIGVKLVGPHQRDAGTIDVDLNGQTLIRLLGVQCPALKHVAIQSGNGATEAGSADGLAGWVGFTQNLF